MNIRIRPVLLKKVYCFNKILTYTAFDMLFCVTSGKIFPTNFHDEIDIFIIWFTCVNIRYELMLCNSFR